MSFDPLFDSESDVEYVIRKGREVALVASRFAAACPDCGEWPVARYDGDMADYVVSCCGWEARGATPHKAVGAWCDKVEAVEDERRTP